MLGIPNKNSIDLQIMNYLILITKGFINRKKDSKIPNLNTKFKF